jgi:hypothetical protein
VQGVFRALGTDVRDILCSLEAEAEARQLVVKLEQSSFVSECAEKLQKCAANIKILGRLAEREAKLVAAAVSVLKVEQPSRDGRLYQTFLLDVYHECGVSLVVLSAASLGKQRIVSLNARDRVALLQYLKTCRVALTSSALDSLIEKHQIPYEPGTTRLTITLYHCN